MRLKPEQREKLDSSQDILFYAFPRFVTHVDDGFIAQLSELYRDRLTPDMHILDMMSSWVSHLPEDREFARVEGHGLNADELAQNPRLDHYVVQDLNAIPQLPWSNETFDAVLNAVSVQYLQYPEAIFAEIYRILKPRGIVIVSFSNRMFYQKAITAWRDSSEASRLQLVQGYFQSVSGFSQPETVVHQGALLPFLQVFGLAHTDPFYAVIARRQA